LLLKEIAKSKRSNEPGKGFHYSCPGYIVSAAVVEKVSGQRLADFAAEHIFKKLGMKHTFFNPPAQYLAQIAPTEVVAGKLLHGIVHDPGARMLGGVSGNAGLFSTARDLAKYASMLLNNGLYGNTRIFSPLTIKAFTQIYPSLKIYGRSPGWDVFTDYSSPRGDLLPVGSFGHS
ncbi:MAG: serine hydrolase, partial [bacterium]|nr:serine hydrolase [bacterium]